MDTNYTNINKQIEIYRVIKKPNNRIICYTVKLFLNQIHRVAPKIEKSLVAINYIISDLDISLTRESI